MASIDDYHGRLASLDLAELHAFARLVLQAIMLEESNAPAPTVSGPVVSTGSKPGTRKPTSSSPGCSCGCASPVDHWASALQAAGDDLDLLRGTLLVAYRVVRPHPDAGRAAVEDSGDRDKRLLRLYEGWKPEDVAFEQLSLMPWTRLTATDIQWQAEVVRRLRRSADRHPETGLRTDRESEVDQAQRLRDTGMSLRSIGKRVGHGHDWVARNTRERTTA